MPKPLAINKTPRVKRPHYWLEFDEEALPFCCGVSSIGNFVKVSLVGMDRYDREDLSERSNLSDIQAGMGMFTAEFVVGDEHSEYARRLLKKHFKLLKEFSAGRNLNSKNHVIMCVFSTERKEK